MGQATLQFTTSLGAAASLGREPLRARARRRDPHHRPRRAGVRRLRLGIGERGRSDRRSSSATATTVGGGDNRLAAGVEWLDGDTDAAGLLHLADRPRHGRSRRALLRQHRGARDAGRLPARHLAAVGPLDDRRRRALRRRRGRLRRALPRRRQRRAARLLRGVAARRGHLERVTGGGVLRLLRRGVPAAHRRAALLVPAVRIEPRSRSRGLEHLGGRLPRQLRRPRSRRRALPHRQRQRDHLRSRLRRSACSAPTSTRARRAARASRSRCAAGPAAASVRSPPRPSSTPSCATASTTATRCRWCPRSASPPASTSISSRAWRFAPRGSTSATRCCRTTRPTSSRSSMPTTW